MLYFFKHHGKLGPVKFNRNTGSFSIGICKNYMCVLSLVKSVLLLNYLQLIYSTTYIFYHIAKQKCPKMPHSDRI